MEQDDPEGPFQTSPGFYDGSGMEKETHRTKVEQNTLQDIPNSHLLAG